MNKKLDLDRPLETEDGYPVRLICSDAKGHKPVIVLIGNYEHLSPYYESSRRVTLEGKYFLDKDSPYDIINKKIVKTIHLNMYSDGSVHACRTRDIADTNAGSDRIACKEVEITEGEGLNE